MAQGLIVQEPLDQGGSLRSGSRSQGVGNFALNSKEGTDWKVLRTFTCRQRPESSLGCLICAIFTRHGFQVKVLNTFQDVLSSLESGRRIHGVEFRASAEIAKPGPESGVGVFSIKVKVAPLRQREGRRSGSRPRGS